MNWANWVKDFKELGKTGAVAVIGCSKYGQTTTKTNISSLNKLQSNYGIVIQRESKQVPRNGNFNLGFDYCLPRYNLALNLIFVNITLEEYSLAPAIYVGGTMQTHPTKYIFLEL